MRNRTPITEYSAGKHTQSTECGAGKHTQPTESSPGMIVTPHLLLRPGFGPALFYFSTQSVCNEKSP